MAGQPANTLAALGDRYVHELFDFNPAEARATGDHDYDGALGPVGAAATAARVRRLTAMRAELDSMVATGAEERAEAITLRQRIASDLFSLVELESPARNPLSALFRGADPQPYCTHDYAPASIRAEGLERQLRGVPDWLDAALLELGDSLDDGPRRVSIDVARGLATFFAHDLEGELNLPGHPRIWARLAGSASAAAAACLRFATEVEQRDAHPAPPLGEGRLLAMLEAQEGIAETITGLRAMADAELARLSAELDEVSGKAGDGEGTAAAVERMEADHPTAASLLDEAAASLQRLRDFWRERDVVTIPDAPCRVLASPPFLRFISAAFDGAGPLAAPEVLSNYLVTPVDSAWSDAEAEEWLRSLNRWTLENIGVHEVYPGHFTHMLQAREQPSLLRRTGFLPGFGEGWAHYTEQLAIEQGLAAGRPLLHLAQVQDALLRACRFRATLALHTEGATVDDATAIFVEHARISPFPARREAERGTFDPMYLSYTYGKMQILSWRGEREQRPGFSLRTFHDTMLGSGFPPLAAVRELVLAAD